MDDIQITLEKATNLISAVLEDDVSKFSIKNQEKLGGVMEDLLDIINDFDKSTDIEYPIITDVHEFISELEEIEAESW